MNDHDKLIEELAELRRKMVALRESQGRAALLEILPLGIHECDCEGRITFVNPAQERITGYTATELLGTYIWDRVEPGPDRERLPGYLKHLVENQPPPIAYYAKNLRKNGEVFDVRIDWDYIRTPQGQVTGFISVVSDVTDQRKADAALRESESQLKKSRDELERRVTERTAELTEANEALRLSQEKYRKLVQRLHNERRTLEYLLRASDHERQLIAYEIHDGLAQHLAGAIMQLQAFDHLKGTHQDQAARAYEAGTEMLRQGHLEARRLIAGVRPPILDHSGVVKAIAHLVHEQDRGSGQKTTFFSSVDFDRLAPILENSLYRIAQEGLANARQHSQSERVEVSLLERRGYLRIEIRDWGVGFDANKVRAESFGLRGIRQRAKLLGGKYRIRSTPGQGTRIIVLVPMARHEQE